MMNIRGSAAKVDVRAEADSCDSVLPPDFGASVDLSCAIAFAAAYSYSRAKNVVQNSSDRWMTLSVDVSVYEGEKGRRRGKYLGFNF